jgi:hypothetical protein
MNCAKSRTLITRFRRSFRYRSPDDDRSPGDRLEEAAAGASLRLDRLEEPCDAVPFTTAAQSRRRPDDVCYAPNSGAKADIMGVPSCARTRHQDVAI